MEGDPLHHRTASGPGTSQGVGFRSGRCVCVCVGGGGSGTQRVQRKSSTFLCIFWMTVCVCVCACMRVCEGERGTAEEC